MSVEHTTQLIQLILNSTLMLLGCALVLGRVSSRCDAVEVRLKGAKHRCLGLMGDRSVRSGVMAQSRKHLRQLLSRLRLLHWGLLAAHYALLFEIASTLILACRTLIHFEWFIPASLVAFNLGVLALMLAVGCVLVDVHYAQRSLMEEVQTFLGTHWLRETAPIVSTASTTSTIQLLPDSLAQSKSSLRA